MASPEASDPIWKWLAQSGAQKLRYSGSGNIVSTCPFHKDSKPSFAIRMDTGVFVCYSGKCGASGNLINFLMTGLGWRYRKASEAAERLDIPSLDDPAVYTLPEYARRKQADVEVSEATIREGHLGLYRFCPQYLLERGFRRDVLRDWEVGYDFGTSRVTLPVRDASARLVGLSKRGTLDYQEPKYLHLGFKKAQHLYGSYRAWDRIDLAVVCEGQLDAIAWAQLLEGCTSAVPLATMGSRVSDGQIRWLAKHCSRVILGFDNDKDGWITATKVGDELNRRMKPGAVSAIANWPDGVKDFGDLLSRDKKDLTSLVDQIMPYSSARLVLAQRIGRTRRRYRRDDGFQKRYARDQGRR